MLYTPMTKKAILLMYSAHEGQTDKSGIPYVFHPYHLAEQMDSEFSTVAALLHDVVEDTDVTIDDLAREFPEEVCRAVDLLTYRPGVAYMEYIENLSKDSIARKVKMADLLHNSDLTRLSSEPDRAALNRLERYREAYKFLCESDIKSGKEKKISADKPLAKDGVETDSVIINDKNCEDVSAKENIKRGKRKSSVLQSHGHILKSDRSFVLASLNICSAHFALGRYTWDNLSLIACKIRQSGADVVALQEVDKGAERSEGVDMTTLLAEMSGLEHSYFIKIRDFQGGEYGTAIISRYPIVEKATYNYPVKLATQGTSCGYVILDVGEEQVTLFNTHLSVENENANTETLTCLDDILTEYINKNPQGMLCCGDFNTNPDKIARFVPWINISNRGLHTYADRSIDNILYSGRYNVSGVRTFDTTSDSCTDHNMLIGKVEF